MAEYRRADRASDKADEIGAKGRQRRRQCILVGKIELAEHQSGRGAVKEEVVPLDGGADGRCDDRLAQLRAVVGWGQRPLYDCHSHWTVRSLVVSLPLKPVLDVSFQSFRRMLQSARGG
jgi:hypothetical protein